MMKFLFFLLLVVWLAEGFCPPAVPFSSLLTSSSSSSPARAMGLFDGLFPSQAGNQDKNKPKHRVYQGMSKKEEAIRKKNTYQGPKITVREDEDSAMWVEEPKKKQK